jgi:hypothetical protein
MMIRYITMALAILLATNAYANQDDDQVRYQLEQQFALVDAEAQASRSRVANPIILAANGDKQTTIVDEGGSLKIIDKDKAQQNKAAEPKSVESMPAAPGQAPNLNQP